MKRVVVACICGLSTIACPALAQQASVLPHDLTVTAMYRQADWVVKTVMWTLALASVASLSIWICKLWELVVGRRAIGQTLQRLAGAADLQAASALPDSASQAMVELAVRELGRYPLPLRRSAADGIKERVAALILRVEASQQRRLSRGISVLGSIGAAAPFVGLFGTVWGIMNSFIGIAQTQTTNLAVVAPGIAEALLTTALGLVAAIPAVLLYNAITRAIAGYRLRLNDAATQVMCLLSRELDVAIGPVPQEVSDGI